MFRTGFLSIIRSLVLYWYIFTILIFLYSPEFYLQHVLQINYYIHVYTLIILPIFKMSV